MKEKYKLEDLLMCPRCGMPFELAYDPIAKEVTGYLYKPNCKCYNKKIRISVG